MPRSYREFTSQVVKGRLKPASAGRFKTSHFEEYAVRGFGGQDSRIRGTRIRGTIRTPIRGTRDLIEDRIQDSGDTRLN